MEEVIYKKSRKEQREEDKSRKARLREKRAKMHEKRDKILAAERKANEAEQKHELQKQGCETEWEHLERVNEYWREFARKYAPEYWYPSDEELPNPKDSDDYYF